MRCDGNADAVRKLHHPSLLEIRQADVALDQVVLQDLGALQFHLELRDAGNGDAHLVVDPLPLHQIAGAVHAWASADSSLIRFAVLDGFVRRIAGTSHSGNAEGQPRPAVRFTEVLLEVRVKLDESGHDGQAGRVHHAVARVNCLRVRRDRRDHVAVDHDVHVGARIRARHIHQRPGVDHGPTSWQGRTIGEIERNRLSRSGLDVDSAERIDRLIEHVPRVSRPTRRVRTLGRDAARWTKRLARSRNGPDGKHTFIDGRHLGAVGRPDRTAAAARVDRQHRNRGEPRVRRRAFARRRRHGQHLVRAFPEPARLRCDLRQRDTRSVRRPGWCAGLCERLMDPGDRASANVQHRDLRDAPHAIHIEEDDARAVWRPGCALRLRGEGSDLAARACPHVANPQLQVFAVLVRRVHQLRTIRRPRRVGVERSVVREVDWYSVAADRQQIDVADGCEDYLLSVGRDVGTHQSQNRPRCSRGEASNASLIRTFRARHLKRGRKLDRLRRWCIDEALANATVRDVDECRAIQPRRAKRKDILGGGLRSALQFISALVVCRNVVQQFAARTPRRRIHTSCGGCDSRLCAIRHRHGPDAVPLFSG